MDCAPLARRYLWTSSALALLAGASSALVSWRRRRLPPALSPRRPQSPHSGPRRRWLLWLAGALTAAWGALGTALAASDSCAKEAERALVALVAAAAVASLLAALALLVTALLASAQAATPSREVRSSACATASSWL